MSLHCWPCTDGDIQETIRQLTSQETVTVPGYTRVKDQLLVDDGLLLRSVKLPPNRVRRVPVLPLSMTNMVIQRAHQLTAHGGWEATWKFLREECFFPNMAEQCRDFVDACTVCTAASPMQGPSVPPSRPVSASGPWDVVHMDTLTLGPSHDRSCSSVLICVDAFTKWAEVVPLERNDAVSVAAAFVQVCGRWGPPRVLRCDNGRELMNAVTRAVFEEFGVSVVNGAVRHPQSQGVVERFNRTLLTMIRKVLKSSDDWKTSIGYYSTTTIQGSTVLPRCHHLKQ